MTGPLSLLGGSRARTAKHIPEETAEVRESRERFFFKRLWRLLWFEKCICLKAYRTP